MCRLLNQKAADAHTADILAADGQSGENPVQYKVEPIYLWRTGAAWRTDDGFSLVLTWQRSKQKQIAWFHGHAEMLDAAPSFFDGARNHVAPIGDRAGTEYHDQIAVP